MLEDLYDAARVADFRILDDFLLEVGRANLFDKGRLFDLLTLIEVMKFAVEELLDQLVQVLPNLVEEHDLSVLVHIRVSVVLRC